MSNSNTHTILSVAKALKLIDIMAETKHPMTLLELSTASGYPRSTIHTLLGTLIQFNYAIQNPDGRYYLGTHLFECGCVVSEGWDVSGIAQHHIEHLAGETGYTVVLCYLDKEKVFDIIHYYSRRRVNVLSSLGLSLPLHASAPGKLLLSTKSEATLKRIVSEQKLQPFTPYTLTNYADLKKELEKIKIYGYSESRQEYRFGLNAVSAPIMDHNGKPQYAISVVGFRSDIADEELLRLVEKVKTDAEYMSLEIGENQRRYFV